MGLISRYRNLIRKAYFYVLRNGYSRAEYLRKHQVLSDIGDNVYFYSRIYPSDPKLLKLGDNVIIATNVRFLGHDRIDLMLNGMTNQKHKKVFDCIEVGNNCFLGSDVIVLPGVKIGDNTIIGAGAVVTKDLPSGHIWGGVPAKQIGDFQTFIDKRESEAEVEQDPEELWEQFYKCRQ